MRRGIAVLLAAMVAAPALAGDDNIRSVHDVRLEAEAKMQSQVLDVLLGPGNAYLFLEAGAELKVSSEKAVKAGIGKMHKAKAKGEEGKDEGDATAEQMSSQEKKSAESRLTLKLELEGMKLRILHDAAVPAAGLKAVKEALLALYPGSLRAGDIVFVPARFERAGEVAEPYGGVASDL